MSFVLNAMVGAIFLLQDVLPLSLSSRQGLMMLLAALIALSQVWDRH